MINVKTFIATQDYKEFRQMMFNEFKFKPLEIITNGMTDSQIALEVKGSQLAVLKLEQAFKSFEGKALPELVDRKPMR